MVVILNGNVRLSYDKKANIKKTACHVREL